MGLGGRHASKATADVLPRTMHTIHAEAQRHVATNPPRTTRPKAGALNERKPTSTNFRLMYDRGDLPLRIGGGVQ